MPALEQFTLLQDSFLTNILLPIALVFTVVFAILERTKIISEKRDIHALVALILSLLAVGIPSAIGILKNLIPLISMLIIILFAWFLVFGFAGTRLIGKDDKQLWSPTLKRLFSIILGVILLGIIAYSLGLFNLTTGLDPNSTSQVMQIGLLVGVMIAVVALAVASSHDEKEETKEEEK